MSRTNSLSKSPTIQLTKSDLNQIISRAQARDKLIRDLAHNPSPSIQKEIVQSLEKLVVKSKSPTRSSTKLTKLDVNQILSRAEARDKLIRDLVKEPSPNMKKELAKSLEKLVRKEEVLENGLGQIKTGNGLDLDNVLSRAQIRSKMIPSLWKNYDEVKQQKRKK